MITNPMRADDIPVTRKMLDETTEALRGDIRALDRKMDSRFAEMDGRFSEITGRFGEIDGKFAQIDMRFAQIDARFEQIDARFDRLEAKLDSKFELVLAAVHRLTAIVEEQNARNHYVLDAWASIHDAQERQKKRFAKLEIHAFGIEQE